MPRPSRAAAAGSAGRSGHTARKKNAVTPIRSVETSDQKFKNSEEHADMHKRVQKNEEEFMLQIKKKKWYRLRGRKKVRRYYESFVIQVSVAGLIFLNFIVACCKSQIVPEKGTIAFDIFVFFEVFFGVAFTIELVINMYGSWYRRFFTSAWNWFDFIIVIISLMALSMENLPGISVLRLFRAFRVFRLFKRVPSLRVIIEGVMASLVGVSHAFMILGILMGIWSIMAVEFYGARQSEYFGTFMRAMFSMWQVMTMDSWCSNIARGIVFGDNMPLASLFFISFLIVGGIIMTNVVVAILLEKYLDATKNEEKKILTENSLMCYQNKREYKLIPEEEKEFYEYHKPVEGNELDALEDMDRDALLAMYQSSLEAKTMKGVNLKELVHLLKILWGGYNKERWMKQIIIAHQDEEWIENMDQTSFLLNILLGSQRDAVPKPVTKTKIEKA